MRIYLQLWCPGRERDFSLGIDYPEGPGQLTGRQSPSRQTWMVSRGRETLTTQSPSRLFLELQLAFRVRLLTVIAVSRGSLPRGWRAVMGYPFIDVERSPALPSGSVRRKLEATSEIPRLEKTTGRDGRSRAEEVVGELNPSELERVIDVIGQQPDRFPRGTLAALQDSRPTPPPAWISVLWRSSDALGKNIGACRLGKAGGRSSRSGEAGCPWSRD
jgi:hypothetical protein